MNFNNEPVYVGRDFGGRSLTIDREAIDLYCEAVAVGSSRYAATAPALILHSECYQNLEWYLKNIMGNLHARQEWHLYGSISPGQRVTTRGFIRERYIKRQREYVVKETWVQDDEGHLLNRGITHQSFPLPDDADTAVFAVDKDREKSTARRFEIGGRGGATLEPLERLISQSMCMAFSGPMKNYHNDKEEARKLGFPDIVVQGMLPICLISEVLTGEFGDGWLVGGQMDVRLVNVLWGEETATARAEVTDETSEAGTTRVHLDVWVEKPDETKVIVGRASALRR
jgi:acyl dehydratase